MVQAMVIFRVEIVDEWIFPARKLWIFPYSYVKLPEGIESIIIHYYHKYMMVYDGHIQLWSYGQYCHYIHHYHHIPHYWLFHITYKKNTREELWNNCYLQGKPALVKFAKSTLSDWLLPQTPPKGPLLLRESSVRLLGFVRACFNMGH